MFIGDKNTVMCPYTGIKAHNAMRICTSYARAKIHFDSAFCGTKVFLGGVSHARKTSSDRRSTFINCAAFRSVRHSDAEIVIHRGDADNSLCVHGFGRTASHIRHYKRNRYSPGSFSVVLCHTVRFSASDFSCHVLSDQSNGYFQEEWSQGPI